MTALRKKLSAHALTGALALSLFLLLLGSKWWVLDRYGSDLPNWDQWDAEGSGLLAPWFDHDHFLQNLFEPHNEHRVVTTKLCNLALTLWAGQWDARLECVFNAVIHSAIGVVCWLIGRRWIGAPHAGWPPALLQTGWFLLIALLFGLPLAWQNVTGGFHSQQYLLLALSLATLVALPFSRPWSLGWWLAVVSSALALLTMGSGMLAPALVFSAVAWRCFRGDDSWRAAWPTLTASGLIAAIGFATRVERDFHAHMKAKTVHAYVYSMMHSMQWPVPDGDAWWAALVLWTPWGLVAWRALRERAAVARVAQPIAALGGWVVLQLLATAYARGADGGYPAPRYMDTIAIGLVANGLALGWILTGAVSRLASSARTALAIAWLGAFGFGLWQIAPPVFAHDLPDNITYFKKAEAFVRAFLMTRDPVDLKHDDIPYPSADSLIERLNHPHLHRLLPASVREPLPLKPAPVPIGPDSPAGNVAQPFAANLATLRSLNDHPPRRGLSPATTPLASHPTWGSFGATGIAVTGEWRSEPVTAAIGGWLKFETAGDLGRPGVSLELHDAKTDALVATVRPSRIPGHAWRAAYVRAPRLPFIVVARDSSPDHWLAFSAPVEMSGPSHLAWLCVKNGRLLTFAAAAACLALGCFAFYRHVLFPTILPPRVRL
ncbi:MAG: hypothetical protein HZA93_26715 [Verrucomicrobia bacterium]|nr:hypothetical protein [Verrucomicrobiota bacterium]